MSEEVNYSIEFDNGEEVVTFGTETKSLAERVKSVSESKPQGMMLSQIKKNKKSKREKNKADKPKKKNKKKSLGDDCEIYTPDGFMTQEEYKKVSADSDIFDKMLEESFMNGDLLEDEDIVDSDDIIRNGKNAYENRKKDVNEFKKEFNDELTILYDLLQTTNNVGNTVEQQYRAIEKSRTRGVSKYSNDLLANLNSITQTRMSIVRDIFNIKKSAIDFKLKDEKLKKDNAPEGSSSINLTAAKYMTDVLGHRNEFLTALNGGSGEPINTGIVENEKLSEAVDKIMNQNEEGYDSGLMGHEPDEFDEFLNDRLSQEENKLRKEAGTRNIQLEHENVRVVVYMNSQDKSDWEFVAVNKDGEEVLDYDLPDPLQIGQMTFREKFAQDGRGRSYEIILY